VAEHLDAIASNVAHLSSLEWRLQSSYLRLKQRWSEPRLDNAARA
jgi:hypothetical protein